MPKHHSPPFPHLDAAPLKDMVRGLRFAAERGGQALRLALPLDALPRPAARLADGAVSAVLHLGAQTARGVSGMARALVGTDAPPPPLTDRKAAAVAQRFATATHDGLCRALSHLGADAALIAETPARRIWKEVFAHGPQGSEAATAAELFLALDNAGLVRDIVWPDPSPLSTAEARPIALFGVLLAMLDDPADFHSRLLPAVDLSLALRSDIAAAQDANSLCALFDDFRHHV